MAITPNTNIRLLKLPITIDNKNQLTFASKEAQTEYFLSLTHLEIENCTYQRKDNIIRYPAHIDSILEYNYCIYQNENYTNKWFYAFIINMKYINDNMTEIKIETDYFQTWQFDLIYKQSFIEREMLSVSDDVVGANLIPEGLETGEFKIDNSSELDDLEPVTVIAYSGEKIRHPGDDVYPIYRDISQAGFYINGIPSTVPFILTTSGQETNRLIGFLSLANNSDFVVASFTVPKLAVKDFMIQANSLMANGSDTGIYVLDANTLDTSFTQTPITKNFVSLPTSIDGYTPRNQKLRTYPYIYLGFNAQNGSNKIYRYEDFENLTPIFKVISEVNPNPTICFIPQNYRGNTGDNIADSVIMNGYPTISTRTDTFNIWLAQNGNIIDLQMQQEEFNYALNQVSNITGGISNSVQGNVGGLLENATNMLQNGVNHEFYIKNQMAQIEKQKMLPDKVNLGSSATLLGYDLIKKDIFVRYSIKRQFAEKIDKYFDMYGYLTNNRKVPNINNRPNWNYIKTIGANIEGNIPQFDLQNIKVMFDNGVTLWHNPNTFLDYSQNNR